MAVHKLGGGDRQQISFITNGKTRAALHEGDAVWEHAVVENEPTDVSLTARTFFRLSGGKWQYCVRFPTGATQIIATEP